MPVADVERAQRYRLRSPPEPPLRRSRHRDEQFGVAHGLDVA